MADVLAWLSAIIFAGAETDGSVVGTLVCIFSGSSRKTVAARKSASVNVSEFNGKIPLFRKPDVMFSCVQVLLNALAKHAGIS